jgi:hypothetical protein
MGETECKAIYINIDFFNLSMLSMVMALLFFYSLTHSGDMMRLAATIMLFPALDVYSDLLYLLAEIFVDKWTFGTCLFFFIIPNVLFLYMVYEQGAVTWVHKIFPGFLGKIKLLFWLRLNSRWLPAIAENIDENGDPEYLYDPFEDDFEIGIIIFGEYLTVT